MLNPKVLKIKIKSTWNIKKITKALEIVSTLKLQKLKKKCEANKQFLRDFLAVLYELGHGGKFSLTAPSWTDRELRIVVSTEKWLCWWLNSKLFKKVLHDNKDNMNMEYYLIGKKAIEFFQKQNSTIVGRLHIHDEVPVSWFRDLFAFLWDAIAKKKYVSIAISFNFFKNTLQQYPTTLPLLPLDQDKFTKFLDMWWLKKIDKKLTEFKAEPSPKLLKTKLLEALIKQITYWWVLQNKTSEMAARMIAMKKAKDNATERIKKLTLSFNTARQAAITQEIMEIVAAKSALE